MIRCFTKVHVFRTAKGLDLVLHDQSVEQPWGQKDRYPSIRSVSQILVRCQPNFIRTYRLSR